MKNNIEKILFGVKAENEDWQEELISTNPQAFVAAKKWASKQGFNRFRVATINLTEKPDFSKTINKL